MADSSTSNARALGGAIILFGYFVLPWMYRWLQGRRERNIAASISPKALTQAVLHARPLSPMQAERLRPLVLHWLELRGDLTDAQITQQVPETLVKHWFTLDVRHLQHFPNPDAIMAFACVRVAFYVRAAERLGWITAALREQIVHLNARRTRECFADVSTFRAACDLGRQQWLLSGRSDPFGAYLFPALLQLGALLWSQP